MPERYTRGTFVWPADIGVGRTGKAGGGPSPALALPLRQLFVKMEKARWVLLREAWLLLLAVLLLAAPLMGRAQCPPRPDAAPRLDSTDFLLVEKYLARAVAMNGLTDELVPAPYPWNGTPDNVPCYRGGDRFAAASYDTTLSCAGHCNYPYCPTNFARDVALLPRLRATLVQFTASTWDHPEYFQPGSDFLNAARQTVERINAAYDCAGLRHPLIQASVLESVGTGMVCGDGTSPPCDPAFKSWLRPGPPGTNSGLQTVPIPAAVISAFIDELRTPADRSYYLDSLDQPRTNLHFDFFRVARLDWEFYTPDINLPEAQMWLYYQATAYIDAGFTALHMGQPRLWGQLAKLSLAERPAGLRRVTQLMGRIRAYARRRPGSATPFVLLMAEPMSDPLNYELSTVKFASGSARGQDQLIFDARQAPMRPREVSPQVDAQAGTGNSMACPALEPQGLQRLRCTGQYLATIDPCHTYNFHPDGGGHSALGATYPGQTPYGVYFDHGASVLRQPNGQPRPVPVLTPGNNGTWNWDDAAWFTAALDDSCQADWLVYQFRRVRSFSNGSGFLMMPGRLTNNYAVGVADYRLAAHPIVAAAVEKAWTPTQPTLTFRRAQMSGVSHVVRTAAPGVPLVPRTPGPVFHADASKSIPFQPAGGLCVVYCHTWPASREVGTTVRTCGALVRSPRLTAATRARSTLMTARS